MCSTVQEQITTCGQNAFVKIGERTNIRPQKNEFIWFLFWKVNFERCMIIGKKSLYSPVKNK